MDNDKLQEILVKHEQWLNNDGLNDDEGGERADLRGADLRGADLRGANLRGADLREADLRGVDLDFSVWPLWCGSKNVKVDNRLVYQLVAHICGLDCNTPEFKEIREFLLPYAKQSHRADDLGLGVLNEG